MDYPPSTGSLLYAELVLPLATPGSYHYRLHCLGTECEALIGRRAIVSFGKKRFYTGLIIAISPAPPEGIASSKLKFIDQILDESPIVSRAQLQLWQWMSSYYCCTLGQILRAALPAGLLPESKTLIHYQSDWTSAEAITASDAEILDLLRSHEPTGLTLESLQHKLGRSIANAYQRLLSLGAIRSAETVIHRYSPKMKDYLQLSESYRDSAALDSALEQLKRAPRQAELFLEFVGLLGNESADYSALIERQVLSRGEAQRSALIRKVVERGIWTIVQRAESRILPKNPLPPAPIPEWTLELPSPLSYLDSHDVWGKEQAILSLIAQHIRAGKQVLMLSPQASDVPSAGPFLERLQLAAQGKLYHYHAQSSEAKRTELYLQLSNSNSPCLVLGTRSAVFLPLHALGLIIIDEEHEYVYKQQYVAPFFHARDIAIYLGSLYPCQVLLTSSTPSAETLFNVLRGKYTRLEIPHERAVPGSRQTRLQIIDLSRKHFHHGKHLSAEAAALIRDELAARRRVLIIGQRRGYARLVQCAVCRQAINCPYCDVALSYTQEGRVLRCHYCGYTMPMPSACPSCGSSVHEAKGKASAALRLIGSGSERLFEEVSQLYPEAKVLRLDSDSLQTAQQRAQIHAEISTGHVDIIIGTPLIKGQPIWDNIGLIIATNLDHMLSYPDFRSSERAFQLLEQLCLHAERINGHRQSTTLVIQTQDPQHPFLKALQEMSYSQYIAKELAGRERYGWPPFVRLTRITVLGAHEELVLRAALLLAAQLRQSLGDEHVSPAEKPRVARIGKQYIREIICRRPFRQSYRDERRAFREAEQKLSQQMPEASRLRIAYDVDPA